MHMHKKWFFLMFALFFVLPALKFSGGWALLWLPFLFFWVFSSRHNHSGAWYHPGSRRGDPRKRYEQPEKPKRRYMETVDGEYLEIIEEPRQV